MQRDTKLGYGFLFVGLALAYLLSLILGTVAGIVIAVASLLIGVVFLISGHLHSDENLRQGEIARRTIQIFVPTLELCMALVGISFVAWAMFSLSPDALKIPTLHAKYRPPKGPEISKSYFKPSRREEPLIIRPEKVVFEGVLAESALMTYIFRITNQTDQIFYSVSFKLRVYSNDLSGDDFAIHLTPASRKPVGDLSLSAKHFADVSAMLARDVNGHSLFYFYMGRLVGHDFREVTITRTKNGTATVTGQIAFFTTEPKSQGVTGDPIITWFKFDEPVTDVRPIFLVADLSKDKETGKPPPR